MLSAYERKLKLRHDARQRRRVLPLAEISAQIMAELTAWEVFENANVILCYWPLPDEVSLRFLMESTKDTKQWYLPRVLCSERRTMDFFLFEGASKLEKGPYGIEYPPETAQLLVPEETNIDLILVPALGLDEFGHRLGSGKGYYDRYLAKLRALGQTPVEVGICPEKLILPNLPTDPYDVPMHWILTEQRFMKIEPKEDSPVTDKSDFASQAQQVDESAA